MATFDVSGEGIREHTIGNSTCNKGWCGGISGFPRPCGREDCEGLVHADFGDEEPDGGYWLHKKCDAHGEANGD